MKLATAEQKQALDRETIEEYGIPGIVLMENAGRGTYECMVQKYGTVHGKSVIIVVGPGNNGGDGLVIARHVHQAGGTPLLFFLVNPERLKDDTACNYAIVSKLRLLSHELTSTQDVDTALQTITSFHAKQPVHSLVDAVFGTGLTREVGGHFARALTLINSLRDRFAWPVVAVDIPSGLHGNSGQILGTAVQADLTVTYGCAQPGHLHHGGPLTGTLSLVDIGIPSPVIDKANLLGEALGTNTIETLLYRRHPAAHKGSCGHLLILAGSKGKTGAAILSSLGALHSGVGLATLAVPHTLNEIFEASLPEAMTVPLTASKSFFSQASFTEIMRVAEMKTAFVLGPGIGTNPETEQLVLDLYCTVPQPMVVDADALNILAMHPEKLPTVAGPRILTPHPGEFSRLSGLDTRTIQEDRLQAVHSFIDTQLAGRTKSIITVLKGAGTIIANTDKRWAINTTGNPGMASGGMGDVLAGIIGSLLAQGYTTWDAARLGVCLHGLAADLIAEKKVIGYLASEVALMLPAVLTAFLHKRKKTFNNTTCSERNC